MTNGSTSQLGTPTMDNQSFLSEFYFLETFYFHLSFDLPRLKLAIFIFCNFFLFSKYFNMCEIKKNSLYYSLHIFMPFTDFTSPKLKREKILHIYYAQLLTQG